MENQVLRKNWNEMPLATLSKIWRTSFPNKKCAPNSGIVKELQSLKKATLRLLENREQSTVYQIVESGTIYQVFDNGLYDEFESYQEYKEASPLDQPSSSPSL